ncbi:hypothetical protein LINPERPRIM_LOCUS25691 [Linum perenne]
MVKIPSPLTPLNHKIPNPELSPGGNFSRRFLSPDGVSVRSGGWSRAAVVAGITLLEAALSSNQFYSVHLVSSLPSISPGGFDHCHSHVHLLSKIHEDSETPILFPQLIFVRGKWGKKERSSRREGKEQTKESEPRKSSSKIPSDKRAIVRVGEESPKIKEVDSVEALTTHEDRDPSFVGKGSLHVSGDKTKRKRKNKKKNKAKTANGPSLGPEDPLNQKEWVEGESDAGKAGGSSSGRPDPSEPTPKANGSSLLFAGLIHDPSLIQTDVSMSSLSFSRVKASVPRKEKKKGDKLKPCVVVSRLSGLLSFLEQGCFRSYFQAEKNP